MDLSGFAVSTVFNETKFEESQTLDGNVFHCKMTVDSIRNTG